MKEIAAIFSSQFDPIFKFNLNLYKKLYKIQHVAIANELN